jgi:replicative DNA helicase
MFEKVIFDNLMFNEEYARKVIPFLKVEYFHNNDDKIVFKLIDDYVKKYNAFPTKEALYIDLSNKENISELSFQICKETIDNLKKEFDTNIEWLLDQTEKFCQEKAIYNSIMESINILDDKSGSKSKGSIPQLLTNALSVSFDTSVGHDFIENFEERFDFYHRKEVKVEFDLDYFNKITNGGLPKKTLNIAISGTGVGKTLCMCHFASANLSAGLNVLYITMEMAEERIAERIDANLLDISLEDLSSLPKNSYEKKMNRLKEKTKGKLIIKEYPTACAGSANFRHLLNELKIKKNFIPDIIYIDYLNICISSRIKQGNGINSYTYIKSIAEELRGLAVEHNVPIVSATQVNRSGYTDSDFGLENTSESFGLPATADFMFALISTEELESVNQIMVKQLKNRFSDPSSNRRFVVGIDRSKMRLYNLEESAQEGIMKEPQEEKEIKKRGSFDKEKFKKAFG